MVKIPARFNRFAAAFDGAAKARSWESSGSEHSAADLSDLVNSFLERESREERESGDKFVDDDDDEDRDENEVDFESRDLLKDLLDCGNDAVRGSIRAAVEKAYREVVGGGAGSNSSSSPDFKRRLMARLRSRGFDAGLCKSKWEKIGRCPAGDYEYVDVTAGGTRYIVQVLLDGEFTIARPSGGYASLLEILPPVFVGKTEELKQVVRLMCAAVRKSMRSAGIHVPPWRRLAYMQNKWFASYKRTTNEIPSRKALNYGSGSPENQTIPGIIFNCRGGFGGGVRTSNQLAAAVLNRKEMQMLL